MSGRDLVFYVAMGILGTGLVVLFLNHSSGRTFGMANDDFGRLVLLASLVTVFSAGLIRRGQYGAALRNAFVWLAIVLALVLLYLWVADVPLRGGVTVEVMPFGQIIRSG